LNILRNYAAQTKSPCQKVARSLYRHWKQIRSTEYQFCLRGPRHPRTRNPAGNQSSRRLDYRSRQWSIHTVTSSSQINACSVRQAAQDFLDAINQLDRSISVLGGRGRFSEKFI